MNMKIKFIDKNKKLLSKVKVLEKEFDCFKVSNSSLDNIKADAISTASNPDFTFGGGLDLYLATRFNLQKGAWLEVQKGDDKIRNVVLNITVNYSLKATKELVRESYVNFFNIAKNKEWEEIVITGFGVGVGGLSDDIMIEALREALQMYYTICGDVRCNAVINVKNINATNVNNVQWKYCNNGQWKYCNNGQWKYCNNGQWKNCNNGQWKYCNNGQWKDCYNGQWKDCYNGQWKDCGNGQWKYCNNGQWKYCYNGQWKDCRDGQWKNCYNGQWKDCGNGQWKDCDKGQWESCNNGQWKYCDNGQWENCFKVMLMNCSGNIDYSYFLDFDCALKITNKKTKEDFNDIFFNQFKIGKKYIAYKYLTKEMKSPTSTTVIEYKYGKEYKEKCNKDVEISCSYGIHLATRSWCEKEMGDNHILVEFEFNPQNAVVPLHTDGKFRVSKCKCIKEVVDEDNLLCLQESD